MATISETLPDADSKNTIEATFGYICNTIGALTLGVLPTNSNLGGLLEVIYQGTLDIKIVDLRYLGIQILKIFM